MVGLVSVLFVKVSTPESVANVPEVGKVTFVFPVVVNVKVFEPMVENAPPNVIVFDPLFTPVPPYVGEIT